jgi:cysteine desulfurase
MDTSTEIEDNCNRLITNNNGKRQRNDDDGVDNDTTCNSNGKSSTSTIEHIKECHNGCIYLDYNGTTPIYKEVYDSMVPYFTTYFGNPSSLHHTYGQKPYGAIQIARQQILTLLGINKNNSNNNDTSTTSTTNTNKEASTNESTLINSNNMNDDTNPFRVIFTGCGTEANNLAIHIAIQKYEKQQQMLAESEIDTEKSNDNEYKSLPHIVTTTIEHPATLQCLHYYSIIQKRCTVSYVPVQKDGIVRSDDIISSIRPLQT